MSNKIRSKKIFDIKVYQFPSLSNLETLLCSMNVYLNSRTFCLHCIVRAINRSRFTTSDNWSELVRHDMKHNWVVCEQKECYRHRDKWLYICSYAVDEYCYVVDIQSIIKRGQLLMLKFFAVLIVSRRRTHL